MAAERPSELIGTPGLGPASGPRFDFPMTQRRARPRLVLPRRPFLDGTLSFPFSAGARGRTLLLAATATAVALLVRETIDLVGSGDGRRQVIGAMFTILSVLATVGWLAYASACALAVVRDTASGCDAISSWPGAMFVEWIGEMLSVVAGIGISAAPGIALAWWVRDGSQSFAAIAPVGCFLLFPVVFLSLLENESAFDALSLPVLRSLVTAAAGWCGFYTTSVMLVAAAVVVVATAQAADGRVALVATALVASIVWLVYFRLLGRLAWYCADRAAAAERVATSGEDAVAPRAERPDDAAPE